MTDYTQRQQRRAVTIQQLANSILQEQIDGIMLKNVMSALREYLNDRGVPETRFQLSQMQKAITAIIESEVQGAFVDVTEIMDEFAVKEAGFQYSALAASGAPLVESLKEPARDKVLRYVRESIMTLKSGERERAGVWQDFVDEYADTQSRSIQQLVRTEWNRGFESGSIPTLNQLSRRVRAQFDSVSKTQADALIRTGLNHYANRTREAFARDNTDVIDRLVPLVTFDNRTSDICITISARYGVKGYPIDKRPVSFPAHFNCRTVEVPMTKGQTELFGERTALGGKDGEEAKEAYEGRKDRLRTASQVRYRGKRDLNVFDPEQIKASTPIAKWLLSQPDWFIFDTLGKKKGQAFIDGKLDLRKLTDKDLKPKTVDELGID